MPSIWVTVMRCLYRREMSDEDMAACEFRHLLHDSMCRVTVAKAWCGQTQCNDYKTTRHVRRVTKLPDVLAINCNTDKPKERAFWERKQESLEAMDLAAAATAEGGTAAGTGGSGIWDAKERDALGPVPTHTWLPHQLRIRVGVAGDVIITQALDPVPATPPPTADASEDPPEGEVLYELVASVAHVAETGTGGNFVAHIRVPEIYHKMKEGISHNAWYLFNDFAVSNTSPVSAVTYNAQWKLPVILYYARVDLNRKYNCTPKVDRIVMQVVWWYCCARRQGLT
eukprot:m.1128272 g.1128272  ORF g.1128272 m.1128272 type:complete len:284 (+) comp24413_c0_seq20:1583-2434(+)